MIETETQIGWQDYLAIILRRRWFFIIPCAVIVTATMIVGLFLPRIYRAETIMLVQEQNVMNPLIRGLAVQTPVGERLRILREELLSWTSLSRLVSELKLDQRAKHPVAFEGLIKRLQRDIAVGTRGGSLITISYEDEDPKLAQTLVNTITKIYMDRNVESQSAETETAISFLDSELAVYKKQLEESERSLREFKELYIMQMPVATQLNQQIIELEVALAQLLVENTEEHPTVIQVKRRILDLKQKRNDEIRRVITSAMAKGHDPEFYHDLAKALEAPVGSAAASQNPQVRAAREAYESWVARLDSPVTTAPAQGSTSIQVMAAPSPGEEVDPSSLDLAALSDSASLSLAPREQQELARLTRDYQVRAGAYQQMRQRLERAKITQRLGDSDEGTKFKILEPARLPLRPVRPNLKKLFLLSLLLGIFVGAGAAFVAEFLDRSFQSAEDVQAALALPVIGSISTIVTEGDLERRRQRRKYWVSYKAQLALLKTYVFNPVWVRVDRLLVKWGL